MWTPWRRISTSGVDLGTPSYAYMQTRYSGVQAKKILRSVLVVLAWLISLAISCDGSG